MSIWTESDRDSVVAGVDGERSENGLMNPAENIYGPSVGVRIKKPYMLYVCENPKVQ